MPRRRPTPPKPKRRVRGTGSVQRLSDGTYRARLPARIDARRTAREFRTEAEALAWLDGYLDPQPPAPAALTVEEWSRYWWETYVVPMRAPNTARWYRYALDHLAPLDAVPLGEVRASRLQAIVGELNATLEAAVVQAVAGVWRRCFDAAIHDELIGRNPCAGLTLPKAPPRPGRRHVTPTEASLLSAAIVGHRFEAAYALLLGCGLRIGEVLGLAWEHVDLTNRRAWIQRQWTNSHWRELPKGRVPRWIRLPDAAVAALIRHRNNQPPGCALVLQSPYGGRTGRHARRSRSNGPQPWSRNVVANDLAEIVAGLELPRLTPHAARRGLVSALLDGGVSPATVARRMGHADPAVTLRHYAQETDAGHALAAEITDRYLGGGDAGADSESIGRQ